MAASACSIKPGITGTPALPRNRHLRPKEAPSPRQSPRIPLTQTRRNRITSDKSPGRVAGQGHPENPERNEMRQVKQNEQQSDYQRTH
jgi:hypothetical protein